MELREDDEHDLDEAITDTLKAATYIVRLIVRLQTKEILDRFGRDFQSIYEKKAHLSSSVKAISCFISDKG